MVSLKAAEKLFLTPFYPFYVHHQEFEDVDLDAFFFVLTPQEQIDLLTTFFENNLDQSYYRRIKMELSNVAANFTLALWRTKLLNYAEQVIPKNERYSKIADERWIPPVYGRQVRCVKKAVGDNEKQVFYWQLEFRSADSEPWMPFLKKSEDL